MNLVIKHRSTILYNTIIYLMSCFIFLHVLTSLMNEVSAFHLAYLKQNIFRFKFIFLSMIISIYAVWNLKKISTYLMLLYLSMILFEIAIALTSDFNKLVLFLLFAYVTVAYYFYQIWNNELDEPYFQPNYSTGLMYNPMLYKIGAEIIVNEKIYKGHLTNWKETGAFVYMEEKFQENVNGPVQIRVYLKDNVFEEMGVITSTVDSGSGVGVKMLNRDLKTSNVLTWEDFFNVSYDMGFNSVDLM